MMIFKYPIYILRSRFAEDKGAFGAVTVHQRIRRDDAALLCQAAESHALSLSAFQNEPAARTDDPHPPRENTAVKIKPVLAPVQGQPGLIIPDGGIEGFQLPGGDIGRIAYDQGEFSQTGRRPLMHIRFGAQDPAAHMVQHRVALGQEQRSAVQIRQDHPAGRDPGGNGDPDTAGAGAKVQHPGLGRVRKTR